MRVILVAMLAVLLAAGGAFLVLGAGKTVHENRPSPLGSKPPSAVKKPSAVKPAQLPPGGGKGCAQHPSACGYPDASHAGVPAGTSLAPSGPLSVHTPGAVISGLDVSGGIDVYASNVTIKNTRVTSATYGGEPVLIHSPAAGVTIQDSTIGGADTGSRSAGNAIHNTSDATVTVRRVHIHNATDGVVGYSATRDSYILTNGDISGSHDEAIYIPGGDPQADSSIVHNTLINPHQQTAAVFADAHAFGPLHNILIKDNLMAGGDYVVECCDGTDAAGPSTNTIITNNRFSRMYWTQGGQYGAVSGLNSKRTIWSGNIWDDNLRPVDGNG